ncbi:hypothetical protein RSOLAG22IIIB_12551 [Rhizoctonia solani]|uniref:Transmembrane protein n=1 Tax=Rhizoctonia solani TaxID=456999 RepID=A0A0K6GER9_9AGAM|nr:hypothetical protein RSOLAG22IIIB_12551 [Rhizoctonia solani]
MLAFSRIASFLLFVLSLSFLTCAAPTAATPNALAVRSDDVGSVCLGAVVDLKAKLQEHLEACAHLSTVADAQVRVGTISADINVAIDAVVALGADLNVSADIKAKIAAELALVIRILVKICASLVAKLGLSVVLALCVQIDALVKILLFSVDACVSGVIVICAKLLVDIDVNVLLKLNLDLCAKVLGLVKVKVGAAVGVAL